MKDTYIPFKSNKFIFHFPNETIFLEKTINIFPGNYCYPLLKNYKFIRQKLIFYRYYGEEKINEVTEKTEKLSCANSKEEQNLNFIPDDLWFNSWILIQIQNNKGNTTYKELKQFVNDMYSLKIMTNTSLLKRLELLYDRYHNWIPNNKNKFYHWSIGINEEITHNTLLSTNKQLFCNWCLIYDCIEHSTNGNEFDNVQSYNLREYWRSYRILHEIAVYYKQKEILDNDSRSGIAEEKMARNISNNSEEYNSWIDYYRLNSLSPYINWFEKKAIKKVLDWPVFYSNCGQYCYKNLLQLDNEMQLNIFKEFTIKWPKWYEMYLNKLLKIFKYDPCSIARCMKILVLDDEWITGDMCDNQVNTGEKKIEKNSLVECYMVFIRIISWDYNLKNVLSWKNVEMYTREKEKKKYRDPRKGRISSENYKDNKIIPYQPCVHWATVECNEKCDCSKRGHCEKYCACNKQICKLIWEGCTCRGSCLSQICPCFISNRECDEDRCQSCKSCKNLKVHQRLIKNLAVADSSITGWGLFAKENIEKEDLIGEYIGEIINNNDLNERCEYIDLEKSTYMFTLNDEFTVDSRTMGNILRFANHSKSKANAYAKIVFSEGNHRICLYASKNIPKGEEIFFDYDGQNVLCSKYDWINDDKNINIKVNERSRTACKTVATDIREVERKGNISNKVKWWNEKIGYWKKKRNQHGNKNDVYLKKLETKKNTRIISFSNSDTSIKKGVKLNQKELDTKNIIKSVVSKFKFC